MADEVIIRDHAGNDHVFPAGFDPVKAGQIVQQENLKAGLSPLGDKPASVPAETWSQGFHQSLKDQAAASMAGGTDLGVGRLPATVVGLAEGIPTGAYHGAIETLKLPFTLLKGVAGGAASLLTDPMGTLTKLKDTAAGLPETAKKALDAAIQLYQTDPEAFAKAAGELGGAAAGGELVGKIPVKPGVRLAGRALESASEHPFAARMAGGAMFGRGVLKGNVGEAAAGAATMAIPKAMKVTGQFLRKVAGDDVSPVLPSGARTIDVGDTSQLKGVRVSGTPTVNIPREEIVTSSAATTGPYAGSSTGPAPYRAAAKAAQRADEAAAPAGAAAATEDPLLQDLIKKGLTPEQAAKTAARMKERASGVRTRPPVTPVEQTIEDAQRGYAGADERVTAGTSPTGTERRTGAPGGSVAERAAALRAEGIVPPASKAEGAEMVNNGIKQAREARTATYIGMQDDGQGGSFPLFNVPIEGGGQTTVTADKLKAMGVAVPPVPKGGTPGVRVGRPPVAPTTQGASIDDIIKLRTEHGAEEAGTKLASDPRFAGMSKTERTNAIRSLAKDEAGLLPTAAQKDIDAKLNTMGSMEAKAYLAKAPNATAYNYIAKRMKLLGLLVDEE